MNQASIQAFRPAQLPESCPSADLQDLPSETSLSSEASALHEVKPKPRAELKLVYRTLRLISDWALSGFFSEVYIEGEENVRSEGALILTPSHHNEIIDIATLSATIPHRRIIAYWTKASLFRDLVVRLILKSAGAIPVARSSRIKVPQAPTPERNSAEGNENHIGEGVSPNRDSKGDQLDRQQALFDATYNELAKNGGVLGVFPEGTSYTLPRIVQVKEGAARAALGYVQWISSCKGSRRLDGKDHIQDAIEVVPVGIVYTDKSRYRSRLYVCYGKPIDLQPFLYKCTINGHSSENVMNSDFQQAVRGLTSEIEMAMVGLTINAPNWDVLYASQTARAVLWEKEGSLRLQDFTKASKVLVSVFERAQADILELRSSLLRYHALLYHAGFTHEALIHIPLLPPDLLSSPKQPRRILFNRKDAIKLASVVPSLASPLLFSLPTHLAHIPAYVFASVASRTFAGAEEEAHAQYKVIFGGVGRALGTITTSFALARYGATGSFCSMALRAAATVSRAAIGYLERAWSTFLPTHVLEHYEEKCLAALDFVGNLVKLGWMSLSGARDWISILGIAWLLCAWHARVIDSDYLRFKRVRTTLIVLRSILFSRAIDRIKPEELRPYLSTPPPPINPFISKSLQVFPGDAGEATASAKTAVDSDAHPIVEYGSSAAPTEPQVAKTTKVSKSELVRYLLLARAEAVEKLRSTLRDLESSRQISDGVQCVNGGDVMSEHGDIKDSEEQPRSLSSVATDVRSLREYGAVF